VSDSGLANVRVIVLEMVTLVGTRCLVSWLKKYLLLNLEAFREENCCQICTAWRFYNTYYLELAPKSLIINNHCFVIVIITLMFKLYCLACYGMQKKCLNLLKLICVLNDCLKTVVTINLL
jgi:hypothetical protein